MSLESNLTAVFQAIGADIKALRAGGTGSGGGITALNLANAAPNTLFRLPWNGSAWTYAGTALTARPSSRTDLYFDLVGAPATTADPAWLLDNDTRTDL